MYTYGQLEEEMRRLKAGGAEVGSIGTSLLGRPIPYASAGSGKAIIVTGGIHARENLTSRLVAGQARLALGGATAGFRFIFVPMLNPDGVTLIETGGDVPGGETAMKINGGSRDFSLWKANARGVDLNVNFDARFGSGRQNVFSPAPESYVGPRAFSEPETRAIKEFTLAVRPVLTVSFHAAGRIVYWSFHSRGELRERCRALGQIAADSLSYSLGPAYTDSAGGYKDWCISSLGIPALTVEVASDKIGHPLPGDAVTGEEEEACLRLPFVLAEKGARYL